MVLAFPMTYRSLLPLRYLARGGGTDPRARPESPPRRSIGACEGGNERPSERLPGEFEELTHGEGNGTFVEVGLACSGTERPARSHDGPSCESRSQVCRPVG